MEEADKTLVYLTGIAAIITFLGIAFNYGDDSITGMAYRPSNILLIENWAFLPLILILSFVVIAAFLIGRKLKK